MAPRTWFTADTHFGHAGILRHTRRPWTTADEMDAGLIERWNGVVAPGDRVIHLGDLSFHSGNRTVAILGRLHGRLTLVPGNHDRPKLEWPLEQLPPLAEVSVEGQRIVLCHFPLLTWNKAHYGSWHLHGHSHGSLRETRGRRLDVGIDCHPEFRPFAFEEVARLIEARGFDPVDHHGAAMGSDRGE